MHRGFGGLLFVSALVAANGGACAMAQSNNDSAKCRVVGAEKLLSKAGGAAALCKAIDSAVRAKTPAADYRVEVRASSPREIGARIFVSGRALPEQHLAVMDRAISAQSIARFAGKLADQVAAASARKPARGQ